MTILWKELGWYILLLIMLWQALCFELYLVVAGV